MGVECVQWIEYLNSIVWGAPTLCLILGLGIYFTRRLRFAQLRLLPKSFKMLWGQFHKPAKPGEASPFSALCTALGATVGTGNIAGVAGAITIGGPGAVFWMWVSGFLGMILKYAEATLAVRYRVKRNGEHLAGPMYMIQEGLGISWIPMAKMYSFFGVVAAFGVGNATQIDAVLSAVEGAAVSCGVLLPGWWMAAAGAVLAVLVYRMFSAGAGRVGELAQKLVPAAAAAYILLGVGVLMTCREALPGVFIEILRGAFSPRAVTGGAVYSVFTSLRVGISRGVFTNEAGMGTAAIAHGAAQVEHPCQQGLFGIFEVFLDTIVICTITALVILCSGIPIPYGSSAGAELTTLAFASCYGSWAGILLSASLACFAIATILGWGLYGLRCAQYLLGDASWKQFALLQAAVVLLGSMVRSEIIWALAEVFNGLMAIPNLLTLWLLRFELYRLSASLDKFFWKRSRPCGIITGAGEPAKSNCERGYHERKRTW